MNKKILVILIAIIIILAIFTGIFIAKNKNKGDNNTLIMVTEAGFAPYEYYEGGEIVGIDVEIAKEIAKELGKELVIKDVEFDSILNEVKFGRGDFAAAGLTITPERAEEVDFSIEYTKTKQVVLVRKDSDINSIEDIHGKKFSIQTGSLPDLHVSEEYNDVEIIRTNTVMASVEDVKAGKVDFTAMDELPAIEVVNENPELRIIEEPLVESSFGIAVKKGNESLLNSINSVLKRLQEEGKIEEYTIQFAK